MKITLDDIQLAKIEIPDGMNNEYVICTTCFDTLRRISKEKIQKTSISENTIPSKQEELKLHDEIVNHPKFCSQCGSSISIESNYCSKCGSRKLSFTDLKNQKVIKKSRIMNKFQIILGVFMLLSGVVSDNWLNAILGSFIFIIGFVSLKNTSKAVQSFLAMTSGIIAIVIIVNMIKHFT